MKGEEVEVQNHPTFLEQKPCHLEERLQKRMFLNFRQTLRPGRATGESQTIQVT